jgi:hypothetical protein
MIRTSLLAFALGMLGGSTLVAQGQAPPAATPPPGDVVVVTVQGEGVTADTAFKDALRKALEQGGKQEISSHSEVENFVLIRDTIYARAEGVISDFRVLEQGPAMGGTYFCKLEAQVRKSAIASTWGEVQNVLDMVGRPGIAVSIVEKIDGNIETASILESKIEERLIKSGFEVYDSAQLKAKAEKEYNDAMADRDAAKMQAVAKNFGTLIFIVGAANANQAGLSNAYGESLAMYNCDAMAKMYYTDSGKLIASESIPQTRGGARGQSAFAPQAGKQALSTAGELLVEKIYQTCMQHWSTRISAGDTIELEVANIRIADAISLRQQLADIPGVQNTTYSFSKGIAAYRVQAAMPTEAFVEQLATGKFAALFEIVDVQLNRIQAKAKSANSDE